MGIDEAEDVIKFIGDLADAIHEAKSDKMLNIFDAVKFITITPSLAAAVKGSGQIKEELADLTGEERDKLLADLRVVIFKFIGAFT
jgi:hypothetical protein